MIRHDVEGGETSCVQVCNDLNVAVSRQQGQNEQSCVPSQEEDARVKESSAFVAIAFKYLLRLLRYLALGLLLLKLVQVSECHANKYDRCSYKTA